MNKFSYLVVAFSGMLLLTSCGGTAEKKPGEKPDGKNLFLTNCRLCHGDDGKLGNSGAKDLTLSKLNKEEIFAVIKYGKGNMAPYHGLLNDEEIDAVAGFVLTLKTK